MARKKSRAKQKKKPKSFVAHEFTYTTEITDMGGIQGLEQLASQLAVPEPVASNCPACGKELVYEPILAFGKYTGLPIVESAHLICPDTVLEEVLVNGFQGIESRKYSQNGHYYETIQDSVPGYLVPWLE